MILTEADGVQRHATRIITHTRATCAGGRGHQMDICSFRCLRLTDYEGAAPTINHRRQTDSSTFALIEQEIVHYILLLPDTVRPGDIIRIYEVAS